MSRTEVAATLFYIFTILFCLTMAANVVALVRHWRMMTALNIALNNLIETQNQYNAIMGPPPTSPDHPEILH